MLMAALAITATPLAGTPSPLAGHPGIEAKLVGIVRNQYTGPVNTAPIGLRIALHNGSSRNFAMQLCPQDLRIDHFRVYDSTPRNGGTDTSFGMRIADSSWRSAKCEAVVLQPNAVRTVDYYYHGLSGAGPDRTNANRISLTTDAGMFLFVSDQSLTLLN